MQIRRIYFFLILILIGLNTNGQSRFSKTYGFGPINDGQCVIQTSDNGFAVCGTTTPSSGGQTNFYLVKTDSMGIPSFQYSYGAQGVDRSYALVQMSDSGFLIAGYSNSFSSNSDYDAHIVRTDKQGNLIWEKSFGTTSWDFIYDMKATIDGNFIMAGNSFGSSNGISAGYLVKIDPSGNLIWEKFIEMVQEVSIKKISVKTDGSFVVSGNISPSLSYPADGLIAYLDPNGDTIRTIILDRGKHESINALGFFSNGDLALAGSSTDSTDNDNVDEMILRMDSVGNVVWLNTFTNSGTEEFNDLIVTNDTLLITGSSTSVGAGNSDFHIVKFDSGGNFIPGTGTSFGGGEDDFCYRVITTNDGGYVFVGTTSSYGPGQQSVLLIKSDSLMQFNATVTIDIKEINSTSTFTVFPNPSSGFFTINSANNSDKINCRIYDLKGKLIFENTSKNLPMKINMTGLANGFYFLELKGKNFSEKRKIIISN